MQHSFDIDIAKEHGLLEAILLNHLWFWIKKNEANDKNYYDNNYWTYNSTRAFNELFPYVSQRQIQNALNHLKEKGIILTGNYNKSAYDRTLWYAFSKKGKCIMQKCKMEDAEMLNGLCNNVKPIPDINQIDNSSSYNNKEEKETLDIFEDNLGRMLAPIEYEKLKEWGNDYSKELIEYALKISILNNKKNFNYIGAILRNWKTAGYNTKEEVIEGTSKKISSEDNNIKIDEELLNYNWFDEEN